MKLICYSGRLLSLSLLSFLQPWPLHRACIVDADNRIVGLGYNGFPRGCSDDNLPWARSNKNPLDNKYLFVCHAEVNGKALNELPGLTLNLDYPEEALVDCSPIT